ncbi:hypothetical protein PN476_08910, partial [Dolichospermum circinale CS-537/05]|nr:hypothetical protein [Dolichospermum circinale CS-537/05]
MILYFSLLPIDFLDISRHLPPFLPCLTFTSDAEVLNVKILRIVSKLCIGIGDTKFDQLMTLFS